MNKELRGIVKAWEAKVKKSQAAAKNRANSIFSTMSVAYVDDDETYNPGEIYHVEKVFSNGDVFIGQWGDNCPNGHGKYLWVDGCMYVGDWCKGKAMGKGKFSWPSGATYEGQFKNGYMDGEGCYTGSSNDTYRGTWVMNMKHGTGTKNYANGDYYAGAWRRGQPDGQGRYVWNNGNQYIGHWRLGRMNGNGTMMWANGNRYDGSWEDGLPKGNGTFRWADGSFYVGVWSKDEQSGTYYPSASQMGNFEWDPEELFLDLRDCRIDASEKVLVFPSQKMVNWPCEGGSLGWRTPKVNDARPRRASIDGRLSNEGGYSLSSESDLSSDVFSGYSGSGRELNEGSGAKEVDVLTVYRPRIIIKPTKRQGVTISKGHKNYELMLNLQLGIRYQLPLLSFCLTGIFTKAFTFLRSGLESLFCRKWKDE